MQPAPFRFDAVSMVQTLHARPGTHFGPSKLAMCSNHSCIMSHIEVTYCVVVCLSISVQGHNQSVDHCTPCIGSSLQFNGLRHQPLPLQASWRGTSIRLHSGRRKADMRLRLQQAASKAALNPHRQLGAQTRTALQQLAAAKQLPQASSPMATLSMCSQYSKGCCQMIAGRSSPH